MNDNDTHGSRKQIILREAARLFREKGYNASTLREVAKQSGIQGGSVYHHFSSKQDILFQIMDCTMSGLRNNLAESIREIGDPVKKLRKAIRCHIEHHIVDPDATFVTDTELRSLENGNDARIAVKRREYENVFAEIVRDGVRAGLMNVDNVSLACKAILQMCTGVSLWFKPGGSLTIHEIAENYADFVCHGVKGRAKARKGNTVGTN